MDDLQDKVSSVKRMLGPSLSAEKREELFARLAGWEVWLERQRLHRNVDRERLNRLRKDLQFLRLDLSKQTGF